MEKLEISTVNHHVGSTERVFVAHVNDLNDFYLHSDLERESLCKLGQDLYNEYSQSFTESSGINEIPNVGDYCACPSESEDWYRGLIRQIDHNNNAVVFKLDYGDVQCVPICFLRPLRKRFFHIHHLAFHCSLANLIRPVNGWSSDIIEEFRSRLTTTFLYAKFINYNAIRNISEVEITEKSSKIPLNKDFEQYQMQRSILQADDEFIYKSISMEKLDYSQLYQIRILYYISPSRFYVYLHDKLNAHMSFQKELQDTIQDCRVVSSPTKYQIVAVQDNCAIWHRAVIIDFTSDLSTVCVYFTDIGQKEYTSINNIRHLPEEFRHKPAFAIPCRLYQICSIDENNASIWKSDDPVHDEINRLLINNVACRICAKQDQICYDVEIEVPKVGDLSAFLIDKKLVSRTKMNPSQRPNYGSGGQAQQHSFVRNQLGLTGLSPSRTQQQQQPPRFPQPTNYPNNGNNMIQQTQTRTSNPGLYNNTVQQPPSASSNYGSSFNNSAVQPQNGHYIITQVHSALEFYGLPQQRVGELENVSKHFEDYYNNSMNDQSINVNSIVEGNIYVIQSGEKYHRAIIKHCESKSRVSVKLIDRGDEIIADSSELLQIERKYSLLPVFAQSFRLRNYDEAQSTANITRNLKKLILNQHVRIELRGPITNGFYPVEVFLNDNRSVNELLLSNDKNVTTPIANTKPTYNQPQHTHIESQVFSNSNKHHSTMRQDLSGGHFNMNQRTNDILPTPPRTLTGASRMQSGRFSGENQSLSKPSSSNEQMARFSSANNRNQQPQTAEPTWNNPKPTFDNNNMTNQQSFGRQPPGLSQFNNNQRMDDNKTSSTNRFPSSNYDNQQSSPSSGNTYNYDRSEKQTSAYNYQQNNDETNENNVRRSEFSSRGSSGNSFGGRGKDFSNQRGQSGFSNRNIGRSDDDNNNENSFQSSGGFSRGRPGGSGARGGARGGHFPERNGSNRNPGDDYNENSMQRSQNFSSNRGGRGTGGGFQNRRDQGNNPTDGDFGRRGGGFSTRGGQRGGERGGRGGFRNDRDRNEFQLNADNNSSSNTWSSMRPAPVNFEAGDRFIENEIPKEAFKFVISHIETANNVFIQLLSKGDDLTKLTDSLQSEYKQAPEVGLSLFKQNQPCLAKSSDGCWYRAIVLSTGLIKLNVRFVDFGDTTDVNASSIRQLAKKYCSSAPYAYPCTFKNVEVVKNVSTESIIDKCVAKEFKGKIETKNSDGKFLLESEEFVKMLLGINAIKVKSQKSFKLIKCIIVHIEFDQQRFFVQDDGDTIDKIEELIAIEDENSPTLSLDEVKQLEPNTKVIATFEEAPYRAIIQSDESEDNVNIFFIDYGNTSSSPKTSLKRCSEQLSSYPYQSKQCQLYGISSNEIDNAFKCLQEHLNETEIEIAIINEKDSLYNVLVYIDNECMNEKHGYDPNVIESNNIEKENNEQEQEQSLSVADHQTNDNSVTTNESITDVSTIVTPEQNVTETEETPSKYRQGLLTHIEQTKPYVYLQYIPESEEILEQINQLIGTITEEDKHNSSYEIGDHVIAQFSEDDNYYRARIESYCSTSKLYTVYFLDYGNIDTNVPIEHLYSYSNELEQIRPQAHGYVLDKISSETWQDTVRSFVEQNLNDVVEFYITDENHSSIQMKFDYENHTSNVKDNIEHTESLPTEPIKTITANISAIDNDYFYIHTIPDGNLHVCELEDILQSCEKQHNDQWFINDICIVSNEDEQYYRGQILSINDDKYTLKCIDYGNTLQNVTNEHLFKLPDENIYKQSPLAHQCRLYGIDDENQTKAIEELIKNIPLTEHVTITIENDRNNQCSYVTLTRENKDIVNNQYQCDNHENKPQSDNDENNEALLEKSPDSVHETDIPTINNEALLENSPDSVHETDIPTINNEALLETSPNSVSDTDIPTKNNEEEITSEIKPLDNDNPTSNNEAIHLNENEPSTAITDETNNSISSD